MSKCPELPPDPWKFDENTRQLLDATGRLIANLDDTGFDGEQDKINGHFLATTPDLKPLAKRLALNLRAYAKEDILLKWKPGMQQLLDEASAAGLLEDT